MDRNRIGTETKVDEEKERKKNQKKSLPLSLPMMVTGIINRTLDLAQWPVPVHLGLVQPGSLALTPGSRLGRAG